MSEFKVVRIIDAPVERLWELLLDWEGSAAWMVDATTVRVIGTQREGVGTRVRAVTRIAGIALTDEMTVTAWVPERLIQVRHHRFPIKGLAWWALAPQGEGTRLEWGENLTPPLGALGELGGRILRRPIEAVLARSLARLTRIAKAGPSIPAAGRGGD